MHHKPCAVNKPRKGGGPTFDEYQLLVGVNRRQNWILVE